MIISAKKPGAAGCSGSAKLIAVASPVTEAKEGTKYLTKLTYSQAVNLVDQLSKVDRFPKFPGATDEGPLMSRTTYTYYFKALRAGSATIEAKLGKDTSKKGELGLFGEGTEVLASAKQEVKVTNE